MKLKRISILFIILIFLIQYIVLSYSALDKDIIWNESEIIQEAKIQNPNEPQISSKHCICIERTTEQVLFEKDAYTKCAMASTTKILTGIIIIEECNLNDEVEISMKAANTGGSTLGIVKGEKLTVEVLLYGLFLRSGNDSAVALAEYHSGSVEAFSVKMNEKAREIGLKNSHFVTPHGLDNDDHYTTAYDLAILTNYALKNEQFCKIVGTEQINLVVGKNNRLLNNTNELLGNVDGVYGVKTGFTGMAGRCLVTACKRNDIDTIVVVLGADTKNIRGNDTKEILNYVFNTIEMVDLKKEIEELFLNFNNNQKIQTVKTLNKIELNYDKNENYICPVDKNKISKLRTTVYCFRKLEAPIKRKTVIGKMRIICDEQILFENDIFLEMPINRIKLVDYLMYFVKNYTTFYSI